VRTSELQPACQTTLNFLSLLSERGVFFFSWKNNHLLDKSLDGQRDLDLYVNHDHRSEFDKLLRESNGFYLSGQIEYPYIRHCYLICNRGLVHLHVYFKVLTGPSHLKEYQIPLSPSIKDIVLPLYHGVPVPNPDDSNLIYNLRRYLKITSLTGVIFYLRDIGDYGEERKHIDGLLLDSSQNDPGQNLSILDSDFVKRVELLKLSGQPGSILGDIYLGVKLRRLLRSYKIHSLFEGLAIAASNLVVRVFISLFKPRKNAINGGVTVAIQGPDGSGKSSIGNALYLALQKELKCHLYHYGIPNRTFIDRMIGRRIRNRASVTLQGGGAQNSAENSSSVGLVRAVHHCFLAYRRLKISKHALKVAAKGGIVIFDRYYMGEHVAIDGPKLDQSSPNFIIRILARLEKKIYSEVPRCDLGVNLRVAQATALSRNRSRDKELKECDAEIVSRYSVQNSASLLALQNMDIDNDGALNAAVDTILCEISRLI